MLAKKSPRSSSTQLNCKIKSSQLKLFFSTCILDAKLLKYMLNIFTLFKLCDITTPILSNFKMFYIFNQKRGFCIVVMKKGFQSLWERHTRVMETWSSGITTHEKKLALMIQTGISNLSALLGKGYEHIGSFSLIF